MDGGEEGRPRGNAFFQCGGIGGGAAALEEGIASGATFLASVHCDAPESLTRKPQLARLLATGAFGAAVFLTGRSRPGTGAQWVEL